ncbi:hypothetical protein Tco_1458901 [Tanacetum coccineum]
MLLSIYSVIYTLIRIGKGEENVKLMMEKLFRMELELMLVTQNKAVHKELGDNLVRAAVFASSLEAEQKLEKKNRSRTHKLKKLYKVSLTARVESSNNEASLGEDAFKKGRIDAIDADEEITLNKKLLLKITAGDATTVSAATTTTATITTVDDITLAQALMEIKSTKPKEKTRYG